MPQSPQLQAVYQRATALQNRANDLPEFQQLLVSKALEELQAVLEELQVSEEELRFQNETLLGTRQILEAERQRYQELFDFAPDGYLVTDANGRIQEANAAIATLLRVSQAFLVDKPLLVFVDQPDRATFHLTLDRLQQVNKLQDREVRLRSPKRSPFEAAVTVSTVRNALGQIISLRWLLRDITEQKQAAGLNAELERQVQERTAQLQQALNFEASLKHITDKVRDRLDEGEILQAAVQELTLVLGLACCHTAVYDIGLTTATVRHEFVNVDAFGIKDFPSFLDRVIPMATLPNTYHQLLQGECFQFCETGSGLARHLTVLACGIPNDQGVLNDLWLFKQSGDVFSELEIRLVQQVRNQCAIAIRQARLYQAAQVQVQELKKLDQLKDSFLSTTSHELRSPMANMRMAIRMLNLAIAQERGAAELTKAEKANAVDRYLQILDAECNREIALINDLLDFQRLEAGEHSFVAEPICLQDWLPKIVAPFQLRAGDRLQTVQIDMPLELPILISDLATLERVVTELLTNACKYTPLAGQITIKIQAQPDAMQLIVSNTSVEISPDELAHIFDKFYRIPNSDPWKQGGTGLGLALVQKLTEHLGATIAVESASGQLRFTIELPQLK